AGRAHLMDAQPRLGAKAVLAIGVIRTHVLDPRGLEHFGGRGGHILPHGELVVAPRAVNAEHRDPELVGLVRERDVVLGARQALAERGHAHRPAPRVVQLAFELHAEPGLAGAARPALATRAALIAEPAHVVAAARRLVPQVPEPWDIDAV